MASDFIFIAVTGDPARGGAGQEYLQM